MNGILHTKEGLVSFSTSRRSLPERFQLILASFGQKSGLAFSEALSEEAIQAAFDAGCIRGIARGADSIKNVNGRVPSFFVC